MFCNKCGNQIPDGSAFCGVCGAPTAGEGAPVAVQTMEPPVAQPAPAATNEAWNKMFAGFLSVLKGMFSKDAVKTVGAAAKSTGLEWILLLSLSVLSFSFALAVNIKQMLGAFSGFLSFGKMFGANLVIGLVTAAVVVFALWIIIKFIFKKDVSLMAVLNMVGAATVPLTVCYIANMILGLIWAPIVLIASVIALIMTILLLYVGFQKLDKLETSPFYAFNLGMLVVVIAAALITYLLYKAVIISEVKAALGGMLGGLGSLGGLGDLGDLMDMGSYF